MTREKEIRQRRTLRYEGRPFVFGALTDEEWGGGLTLQRKAITEEHLDRALLLDEPARSAAVDALLAVWFAEVDFTETHPYDVPYWAHSAV